MSDYISYYLPYDCFEVMQDMFFSGIYSQQTWSGHHKLLLLTFLKEVNRVCLVHLAQTAVQFGISCQVRAVWCIFQTKYKVVLLDGYMCALVGVATNMFTWFHLGSLFTHRDELYHLWVQDIGTGTVCVCAQPMRDDVSSLIGWVHAQKKVPIGK